MTESKQEKNFKHARTKKRYWTFVLYPESAPDDWKDILQRTGLEIAISPLHDKDKDPNDESKKPHYHIILCYNNTTTGNAVKVLTDELGQPIPLPVDSVRGLYRYFTHKDNPEKFQYNEQDIVVLNGFNILDYANLSSSDKTKIKLELTKFIKESGLFEYSDFMDEVISLDKPDYFYIASTNTVYFNAYLTSVRNKVNNEESWRGIDFETGEVLKKHSRVQESEDNNDHK